MQTVTFKVVKATLLKRDGTDQVFLQLEAPTPFPAMGYEPPMRPEAQKGKGAEWCAQVGITLDEVIEA